MRRLLHSSLLASVALVAAWTPAQEEPRQDPPAGVDAFDEAQATGFSIPNTRVAMELASSASAHLESRRFGEAIRDLQRLLEHHRGDLLSAELPEHGGRASQRSVHRGATRWATDRLRALPQDALAVYRERFEDAARQALDVARRRGDQSALAEVARRWPVSEAAERAWWALGDLELELGNQTDALSAWTRALGTRARRAPSAFTDPERWTDELAQGGAVATPGIEARRSLALSLGAGADGARRDAAVRRELRLPGEGEGLGPPPGREADEWAGPVAIDPHDLNDGGIFPVRYGDTVLVSNSMRLYAVNAFSGALRWDSGEPPGWDALDDQQREEFFEGLDTDSTLIAPAASNGIAVAALQIPVSKTEKRDFQRIHITRKLPDRRLFAYDIATGQELWNHMPPPGWDGESGSFSERTLVAGPPVVAGARVLVPAVRMQGRIDYHVGCYRLDTGELLWSANLISGQRETNMFGRPMWEFAAPPLRIEGDRVLALTQLGTLAALDLFTGEILWETLYDQIPLPKTRNYEATPRQRTWRNAPPVVAGGIVIATPNDSEDMLGVSLANGALVWSLSRDGLSRLVRKRVSIDTLLGADATTVYLAGDIVAAFEAPSGLDQGPPTRTRWVFEGDEARDLPASGRPVLARDRIVVPTTTQRIEIDRVHGKRLGGAAWRSDSRSGNLLVDDGALFKLSSRSLTGYFEWDALLTRARKELEQRPADPQAVLALGELLAGRGIAEWKDPGDTERARRYLIEADELFERFLAGDVGPEQSALVRAALHDVLRAESRVRMDLADAAGAQRALVRARELAPGRVQLRDTLVEELALQRALRFDARGEAPERERLLDLLDERCADMSLQCVPVSGHGSGTGLARVRYEPRSDGEARGDALGTILPVGLWTGLERLRLYEPERRTAETFAVLHGLLERYGGLELEGGSLQALAADAIDGLLQSGQRDGYDVFAARAEQRLAEALSERDSERLNEVGRLFPHSPAAEQANDLLLEWARDAGDAAAVARIVGSELPDGFRRDAADERELGLLLELGTALRELGNEELWSALVGHLAAHHPLAHHAGRTLAELAAEAAPVAAPEPRRPSVGRFDERCRSVATFEGRSTLLGAARWSAPATGEPEPELVVLAQVDYRSGEGRISALTPGEPGRPLWSHALARGEIPRRLVWSGRGAFARERCVVALDDALIALDARDGTAAWRFDVAPQRAERVFAGEGVVLALLRHEDDTYLVQALDAWVGTPLWSAELSDPSFDSWPTIAGGLAVFLPTPAHRGVRALDLFTGRLAFELELPFEVKDVATTRDGPWYEGGKLILPWFRQDDQAALVALDLARGTLAWQAAVESPDGLPRELESIVQSGERTFLVVRAGARGRPAQFSEIRELRSALPAISNPIGNLRLALDDKLMGVDDRRRVRLPSPEVFVCSPVRGEEATRLRQIHLAYGEGWSHVLGIAREFIPSGLLPLPAVSDSSVAFCFTEYPPENQQVRPQTRLLFLDRATGQTRDKRTLMEDLGQHDAIELWPIGDVLIVSGDKRMEILR